MGRGFMDGGLVGQGCGVGIFEQMSYNIKGKFDIFLSSVAGVVIFSKILILVKRWATVVKFG